MTPGNGAPTLTIPAAFNGPDGSGNGGYSAGLLAGLLTAPGGPAVQVTLRTPPPLDRTLTVEGTPEEGLRLVDPTAQDKARLVAEAVRAAPFDEAPVPGGPVTVSEAARARERYAGLTDHPFPRCYSCGPARAEGEGLRLFAGSVRPGRGPDGVGNTVACTWDVLEAVDGGDGRAAPAQVWAALDCPGGWSSDVSGRPIVLGRMSAQILDLPAVGSTPVVMGHLESVDGRKVHTGSALYDETGRLLAQARATWIALRS
ncbi:hypothetical protein GCM10007079_31040 [Nocardiopsis terrae]|uniref:Thioesterase-like superfamily protein n=1 Tax=Nocardiopsis terrae TaxID=372655 RepID=A0ABR9HIT3_9ACTN|nr:hypothetical protein [Nocardiopsis terrae]MBE1458929.1 hypothetical protein [Nocardiopsis terrae]GHC87176.1 hypothetical protein GCM10007079_31040 [Nocardiopsis terrae]